MEYSMGPDTIKKLLGLGLTTEEVSMLADEDVKTIEKLTKVMTISPEPYPSREGGLTQDDKERIFKLIDAGDTFARIVHTMKLDARSIFRFIENMYAEDWGRNTCIRCGNEFITPRQKENKTCASCKS